MFNFRKSESLEKPVKLDTTSSASGVFIRINCSAETISDNDGNELTKYSYLEAFCTNEEFEEFKLICKVQNKDVSAAQIEYDYKLDTPVEYAENAGGNGFTYKPKWAEEIYAGLIQKGESFPALFPRKIYDSTKQADRAVDMTVEELKILSMFLAQKQEQYFNEKKAAEVEE